MHSDLMVLVAVILAFLAGVACERWGRDGEGDRHG